MVASAVRGDGAVPGGPLDELHATLVRYGLDEEFAQGVVDMKRAKDSGLDAVTRTPGNTFPTTFEQWCAETLKPAVLS